MHRDPLPSPAKRSLASATSLKFFALADAIAKHNEPTQTQLDALERSYNATGQYVMEAPEFRDLTITVHAQGSRAIGTIVRPMRTGAEGFDVDVVVRLRRAAYTRYGSNPGGLINDLFTVVKRYADMHGLAVRRWERCITLEYSDGMRVDIAPIIEDELVGVPYGQTHARVPDRKLQLFEPTNPKGLASAFGDAARVRAVFTMREALAHDKSIRADLQPLPPPDEVQARLLSRLVQLLKLHRNIAFGAAGQVDFSPRSVFITSLAATAYATRAPIPHESPLDLLLDIVDVMPLFIQREPLGGGEHWLVPNVSAPGDNLASGMNTCERQEAFVAWHHRLRGDVQRLLNCIERREGLDQVLKVVEDAFGQRAAQAVRELETPRPVPGTRHRVVTVGTAIAGTALPLPARPHTFFGA